MNILKQEIGIFYKTREWAERVWDNVMSQIPYIEITRGKYKKDEEWLAYAPRYVRLNNGTKIRLLRLADKHDFDNTRGLQLDKIYYEPGLEMYNIEFRRLRKIPKVYELEEL